MDIKKEIEIAEKQIENGDYKEFHTADELMESILGRQTWWKSYLWYPIWRFYDNWIDPITYWYRLKRLWVFITKGFDPRDTWSLEVSISKYVLPRLEYLKIHKQGCPFIDGFEEAFSNPDLPEEEYQKMYDAWDEIMDKMILAHELIIVAGLGRNLTKKEDKQIEEGLKLFARYYRNLWD